ncbi:MAG: hydrogenase small subunit [Halobacteriota archaeon]
MEINRRGFLKLAGTIGAGAVMLDYKADILSVLVEAQEDYTIAWLQGQGCTGCTMSLIQYPDIFGALQGLGVGVPFHPTIMPEAGENAEDVLDNLYPDFLVVEGAVPVKEVFSMDTHYCEVFGTPFEDLLVEVADRSTHVVAAGTCAAFGGISAGSPNPTGARPVSEVLPGKTVINIPGCPAHPDWMVLAIVDLVLGKTVELDELNRPTAFFGELLHDNCTRKKAYDTKKFATTFPSTDECLLELGCKGAVAYSDCPVRRWNNDTNYCIDAGAPCIGCVYEGFPDKVSPLYEEHEIGLPSESCVVCHRKYGMHKGW